MRFIKEELDSRGLSRLIFRIGRDEIQVMMALLSKSLIHTPRLPETTQLHDRMNNMRRALEKSIHPKN